MATCEPKEAEATIWMEDEYPTVVRDIDYPSEESLCVSLYRLYQQERNTQIQTAGLWLTVLLSICSLV